MFATISLRALPLVLGIITDNFDDAYLTYVQSCGQDPAFDSDSAMKYLLTSKLHGCD
jgi:hypothetical protein